MQIVSGKHWKAEAYQRMRRQSLIYGVTQQRDSINRMTLNGGCFFCGKDNNSIHRSVNLVLEFLDPKASNKIKTARPAVNNFGNFFDVVGKIWAIIS